MRWFRLILAFSFLLTLGRTTTQAQTFVVPSVKTGIYIGYVELSSTPLERKGAVLEARYQAKVVPLFFASERGTLQIPLTDEQLAALERGEQVPFHGQARNEAGETRKLTGDVQADAPGAKTGKFRVRISITKKLGLDFPSTYERKE